MPMPILATKLFIPPPRSKIVLRPRLVGRLNEGLSAGCKLTLISASAGFGKTTLVSEWIADCKRPVAWLSLDEGDNDPARFISYLIKALQTLQPGIGDELLAPLQSPHPLQIKTILTSLLNEITTIPGNFLLVLDDYHAIDSQPVDQTLAFLIEHQPPQMHLLIATRQDPQLPLPRLRARGHCTELRAADLRFTASESAEFLNRLMGLNLSEADIAALESRTEGWIVGLQLAALSMQGQAEPTRFIQSFTGSHHFVLDYLVEEVLGQQPENIQAFLLRTSILERMSGPLCDAILGDPAIPGQETLEYLQRTNLFIVPLDDERLWFRYHHLFGELLRQRLGKNLLPGEITQYHVLASQWYEANNLLLEAFKQAAAANDVERAGRLIESREMPLHLRGTASTILTWLESLPKPVLDARPALWWGQAAMLLIIGQPLEVEEKLQAMEAALALAALPDSEPDETTRNLIGRIAAARANVAQMNAETETILVQSRRALEYLHPDNLADRSMATRSLGFAYYIQNDLAEAGRAYAEAYALAQAAGDIIDIPITLTRLGQVQEAENQLHLALETYQRALPLIDEYSPYNAPVVYLGMARIYYEWNELDTAEMFGEKSLQLARQYDQVIDRLVLSEVFLAHLKLARKDATGAMDWLLQAEQTSRAKNYTFRLTDIAYTRALIQLYQGNLDEAAQLVQQLGGLIQARVVIAQGDPSAALALVEPQRQQAEEKRVPQRLLLVKAVQAIVLFAQGHKDKAVQVLTEALAEAEPGGFVRLFVDEGARMEQVLLEAAARGVMPAYVARLLAAFEADKKVREDKLDPAPAGLLVEPLSQRELEILKMIGLGLSNREIGARLYLALDTIKGHNRKIFDKLEVQSRTEAVARAHELGLI